jgi:molecular chaperone HscB
MASPLAQDFFALFDLPRAFEIDDTRLRARYRELQQLVHPDRYAAAGAAERRYAMQLAAHINEGFETLRHPLRRLRYLLESSGVECGEGSGPALRPEFLAEQMEWREELEALRDSKNRTQDIAAFRARLEGSLRTLHDQAARALAASGEHGLARASTCYREMQFMYRLMDETAAVAEHYDL